MTHTFTQFFNNELTQIQKIENLKNALINFYQPQPNTNLPILNQIINKREECLRDLIGSIHTFYAKGGKIKRGPHTIPEPYNLELRATNLPINKWLVDTLTRINGKQQAITASTDELTVEY